MSRAVISKNVPQRDDAFPIATGTHPPDKPNYERLREHVLRDFGIATWGRLRDVSALDSARAIKIIAEEAEKLLASLEDNRTPLLKRQIADLKRIGAALASSLRSHSTRNPQPYEANNGKATPDTRKRCRACGQIPSLGHTSGCKIAAVLKEARDAGMSAPDEE